MKQRKRRGYRMGKRRDLVEGTRERIVAAVVALHEEVGPRNTTIKGIAERAGVERLTVYRHFPDEISLYRACSGSWLEEHRPPQREEWGEEEDLSKRTLKALLLFNGYYRGGEKMLRKIFRDLGEIAALREVVSVFADYLEGVAQDLEAPWRGRLEKGCEGALGATIRHALHFSTWESLEAAGLGDGAKARLELAWIEVSARTGIARDREPGEERKAR